MAERIRAELELENSSFMAALRMADEETSQFIQSLSLFEADERKAATVTQSLADALQRLSVEEIQLAESTQKTTVALQSESVQATSNTAALTRTATATDQVASSKRQLGSTILATSYAVQDFTSQLGTRGLAGALSAIQNNIPMILAGLGVGAGVAGVVSVAAVGVGLLTERLSGLSDEAKKAAKDLEDFKEKADKLRENKGASEKQRASTYGDYFGQVGSDTTGAGIEASLLANAQDSAQKAAEYIAQQEMIPGTDAYAVRMGQRGGRRTNVGQRVRDSVNSQKAGIRGQVNELLVGANSGDPLAISRLIQMARQRGGLFPRGLADDLESLSPEAQAVADAEMEATEAFGQRASKAGAARRRRAGEARQLDDAGRANESATWRAQTEQEKANQERIKKAVEASKWNQQQLDKARAQQAAQEAGTIAGGAKEQQRLMSQAESIRNLMANGAISQAEAQEAMFAINQRMNVISEQFRRLQQGWRQIQRGANDRTHQNGGGW